jgi:hypothetical protein
MCFLVSFSLFFISTLYGQVLDYLSVGYNTTELESIEGRSVVMSNYLLNNANYSKIWIYYYSGSTEPSALLFEIVEGRSIVQVPFGLTQIHHEVPFIYYREREGYSRDEFTEIWRTVDGRLTYAEWVYSDGRRFIARSINYDGNKITVIMNSAFTKRFYNIPENDLLDIFLMKYVQDVFEILNENNLVAIRNDYNTNRYNNVLRLLPFLKRQELAIIRNCIFAKYRYSFQTPNWRNFFTKYYIENYNGIYTNAQVMTQLSDNERWFLDLIIEYERRIN